MTTEPRIDNLPEYPDAPLSAWKHYGILKIVEKRVHQMLQEAEYDGHLVGLRVGYIAYADGGPQPYSMAFGYVVEDSDIEQDDSPEDTDESSPLTEENFDDLYNETFDLISANIPSEIDFSVIVETAVNPKFKRGGKVCRIVEEGECNKHGDANHAGQRCYLRLKNSGKWRCIHKTC